MECGHLSYDTYKLVKGCPCIMLTLSDSSTTALSVHKVMFMCMLTDILSYMAVTILIMSTVFVVSFHSSHCATH